ncbi:MAG TPA: hypothetical protein V6C98_09770 [Thermosynechococcaceae cyanobacterium]
MSYELALPFTFGRSTTTTTLSLHRFLASQPPVERSQRALARFKLDIDRNYS